LNSELTPEFLDLFGKLPGKIKELAAKNYRIWKENSNHPGLNFKKVKGTDNIYSIRIGLYYRALGTLKSKDTIIWFWIGSHGDYDRLIK